MQTNTKRMEADEQAKAMLSTGPAAHAGIVSGDVISSVNARDQGQL
jgi:C-terminal processing protease CtpA/Prc